MNKTRVRIIIGTTLVFLQILFNIYLNKYNINIDFVFLILIYFSSKDNFLKAMIIATIVGWTTDLMNSQIVGVFGFARVMIAFLIFELINFIDFKRLSFTFLFIFFSLSFSNLIANIFLIFINDYGLSAGMLLHQPILTGMFSVLLISSDKIKESINVY